MRMIRISRYKNNVNNGWKQHFDHPVLFIYFFIIIIIFFFFFLQTSVDHKSVAQHGSHNCDRFTIRSDRTVVLILLLYQFERFVPERERSRASVILVYYYYITYVLSRGLSQRNYDLLARYIPRNRLNYVQYWDIMIPPGGLCRCCLCCCSC